MRREAEARERLVSQYASECDRLAAEVSALKAKAKASGDEATALKERLGDPARLSVEHRATMDGTRCT